MEKKIVKNDLFDYNNRYIFQYEKSFKFSLDSILLSEYVKIPNKKSLVLDLCTGLIPIPLILSTKFDNKIYGIEIQKEVFQMAEKSIKYNNLEKKIEIINDDIKNLKDHFKEKSFDIITCNPPFFKIGETSCVNKDELTKVSRHEVLINLDEILSIASRFLKDNGYFYMVYRADRLDELIISANRHNINVKEIINVVTNDKFEIKTILVKCVKNSKINLRIKTKNIMNLKSYKNIFEEGK